MNRFRVVQPDGDLSPPLELVEAIQRVRERGRRLGPRYRIGERGQDPGRWRERFGDAIERFRGHLAGAVEGEVWTLEGELRPAVVRVRVVEVEPPPIATQGNTRIDAIYTFVVRAFPGRVDSAGICNRRPIAGSSTWSQHAPWPAPDPGANAWDWFAPSFDELVDQALVVVGAGRRGEIPLGRLIVADRTWTPAHGWQEHGGQFHRHVHVEGDPTRVGSPAWSC